VCVYYSIIHGYAHSVACSHMMPTYTLAHTHTHTHTHTQLRRWSRMEGTLPLSERWKATCCFGMCVLNSHIHLTHTHSSVRLSLTHTKHTHTHTHTHTHHTHITHTHIHTHTSHTHHTHTHIHTHTHTHTHRRKIIESVLQLSDFYITMTGFPRMGCGQFTDPPYNNNGPLAQSVHTPDEVIAEHPRFRYICVCVCVHTYTHTHTHTHIHTHTYAHT